MSASKIMGLGLCGVDILRAERGTVVMEVNSSPGLEGIEKVTGKDLAVVIIEHIEKYAHVTSNKTRDQG